MVGTRDLRIFAKCTQVSIIARRRPFYGHIDVSAKGPTRLFIFILFYFIFLSSGWNRQAVSSLECTCQHFEPMRGLNCLLARWYSCPPVRTPLINDLRANPTRSQPTSQQELKRFGGCLFRRVPGKETPLHNYTKNIYITYISDLFDSIIMRHQCSVDCRLIGSN
ncbi:hypothetical protein EDC04DRAFT_595571 [Pisolithus marmoratus]|nr:hypothetical protein EDC04DRAFT_595571 [Pisolithus marmoratus]